MEIAEIGEFGLIGRISTLFSDICPERCGMMGIGDDCAVIPGCDRDSLVTTDMLLEGTHFLRDGITPYNLGWKSLAVNLSDIAAMGGIPTATFLSLGIPEGISVEYMDRFFEGYHDLSAIWSVPLLGGDTTRAEGRNGKMAINVGVLGYCPSGLAKKRGAALPGDGIYVTGTLGDSAAGLELILRGETGRYPSLIGKHTRPEPRMKEGRILGTIKEVHAMMDISDGVASDLKHILDASSLSSVLELEDIPMSDDYRAWADERHRDPIEKALSGGEDYELLFTAAEGAEIPAEIHATRIGTLTDNPDKKIHYYRNGREVTFSPAGFDHFRDEKEIQYCSDYSRK